MKTRRYIFFGLLCLMLCNSCKETPEVSELASPQIITVQGAIPADSLGMTLIHEHVFLDWTGADSIDAGLWKEEEAFELIMPFLREMKEAGVQSFLDCTPNYLGRNPLLLQKLAKKSGLQILTNTGYYGAIQQKYVPASAFKESADEIAERWIKEFREGIGGTGIKPGFIKIGLDAKDTLDEVERKIVQAAARTHLATGLTIVAHSGSESTAELELEILAQEGVAPEAFVWTHAQNGTKEGHVKWAKEGAWVSLDGLGWVDIDTENNDSSAVLRYVDFLENLKQHQLLGKTLISHDAGWYTVGAEQQDYKPYTPIFTLLIPLLKNRGFTQDDFDTILIHNPKEAYKISIRALP